MRKIKNNISQRLGLTKTEINTLVFVLITFFIGFAAKHTKSSLSVKLEKTYDYSFQDSLFKALNSNTNNHTDSLKIVEKRVDSNQELSDFSIREKDSKKNNRLNLKKSSINLNTADKALLTKLPGIGPKTAQKIIHLRNEKSGFKSIEELTKVKGIGLKKLQKIKKFLYIDK